jgi:hypothetical protein
VFVARNAIAEAWELVIVAATGNCRTLVTEATPSGWFYSGATRLLVFTN